MFKRSLLKAAVALAAILLVLAFTGCGGSGSGPNNYYGLDYWEFWEEDLVSDGYTKGWPAAALSKYGLTIANPGATVYYTIDEYEESDWTDDGFRDYIEYELDLMIGRTSTATYNSIKGQIGSSSGWTTVMDSYYETTALDEYDDPIGTASIISMSIPPDFTAGAGQDTLIGLTVVYKEYLE